jgi:SAM-dependent methyltransferase
MDAASGFDRVFSALSSSRAYRDAVHASVPELPSWLIPYNGIDGSELARIALETGAGAGDAIVDLACGTGGATLWIARQTGASIVGVDFSAAAIREATALAEAREHGERAHFVVANIESTGLPDGQFSAAVCIDALVFVNAAEAVREIARLLRPGGVFVATSWEVLADDVPLATMVRDYTPILQAAGLTVRTHEVLEGWKERSSLFYRALLEREPALKEEMGEAADDLLDEARQFFARVALPPRVRKVFIVAERPAEPALSNR